MDDGGSCALQTVLWQTTPAATERHKVQWFTQQHAIQVDYNTVRAFKYALTLSHLYLSFSDTTISSLSRATNIIKDFLKQKSVSRFRPFDVQDLLQPLISSQPQTDQVHQNNNVEKSVWWWDETMINRTYLKCPLQRVMNKQKKYDQDWSSPVKVYYLLLV